MLLSLTWASGWLKINTFANMKKKTIIENESYGSYELSGELSDIIKWLQEKKEQGWETMDIDHGSDEVVFSMSRLETDKEFEKRKKDTLKQKEQLDITKAEKAKKELELYQKLKQKYETL